ncbi:ABC transporter permease [Anaerocolumna jejuensis]|uniref:ABC transporter permease n=1 Tax=Anaerocolumna jejuensis TaxID=259063 RepID=UPI003F7BD222
MKDMNYREIILNRIKLLCKRKKILIFSLVLPLLVMGIINFTMAALPSGKEDRSIELGIVMEEQVGLPFSFLDAKEFHIVYGTREKMRTLLQEEKIDAYIVTGSETELFINDMGRKQTIIKGYLDSEIQRMGSKKGSAEGSLEGAKAAEGKYDYETHKNNKLIIDMTEPIVLPDKKNLAFIYITALLCILGARWSFEEMKELMPEYSGIGKKLRFIPAPGWKILLLHLACVYVLQTACILVFSFIMLKVTGISLQLRMELYLATAALGSLSGILTGALFGAFKRINLKVKDILLNAVLATMLLAAFFIPAAPRYFILQTFPLLKLVNPPALITEMLYCIALQDGLFVFLKDGLLLTVYTLAVSLGLLFRYRSREE